MNAVSFFRLLAAGVGAALALTAHGQTNFELYWNLGTTTPVTTPTGLVTGLSGGSLSTNNQNGTVSAPINTSSASNTYSGASGQENAGIAARIGALSLSTNGSGYFSVNLTVDPSYTVSINSISFGSRSTGTGPQAAAIYSSTNALGSAFGTSTLTNNSTWAKYTPTLTSITGTSAIELRIYGYGGTGTANAGTINWRLDDLRVAGTVSAVPEPSIYAALAGAAALCGVMLHRRRQRFAAKA